MTRVLALTGGIGSGKTSVGRLFEKRGAVVICADAITHELQGPGSPLLGEIVEAFGAEVLDAEGALDREALGVRVFRDPAARRRLEALVHPRVGQEMARRLSAAREAEVPLVLLDMSVLFEAKRARGEPLVSEGDTWDAVIVVWAEPQQQLERQIARDERSPEEARRRIESQIPLDEKREAADFVIDNSGSLAELEGQVAALWERLISEPRDPATREAPR